MRFNFFKFFILLLFLTCATAYAAVQVVASTPDLAAIAREIGGDQLEITTIARANADLHAIEVLPSYMSSIQHADVYLKVGMGLDRWADDLIKSASNQRLIVVDCSMGVESIKDKGANGDHEHVNGNPHYWLGPTNLPAIARNIHQGLLQASPENTEYFSSRLADFESRLDSAFTIWKETLAPFKGAPILTCHESWPYFARDFDLVIAGVLESKPGVTPTPSHLAEIEKMIRARHIHVLLKEPYFADSLPTMLNKDTGIKVFAAPTSVGGASEATDVFTHFDFLTRQLALSLSEHH